MSKDIFIKDISKHFTKTINESFYLRDIIKKQTQENKKNYLEIILQDSTGTISGTVWEENLKEEYLLYKEKIVQIKGMVIQNAGNCYQLVISTMQELEKYSLSDYVNGISEEVALKYKNLLGKYISNVKSPSYKTFLEKIFCEEPQFSIVPATLKGHHNYNGGLMIYTLSVTCMAKYISHSLTNYNYNPCYSLPYNDDLIITGGLLHAIGTVNMLKPFPEMKRIPESIFLSLPDLSIQYIQTAFIKYENTLSTEEQNLLLHMVGCIYENGERKPMLREAIILREAVALQKSVAGLEYFIAFNQDQSGAYYDTRLKNYIYIQKEESNG